MVEKEISCFVYCSNLAIEELRKGNIKHAQLYLENAQRSLREVKKLKGAITNE